MMIITIVPILRTLLLDFDPLVVLLYCGVIGRWNIVTCIGGRGAIEQTTQCGNC